MLALATAFLAVASSRAAPPDLTRKVTLTQVATRAKTLLPQIGQLGGVTLTASPQVANEPLVVRLKGVPMGEAMKRIATACGAEWSLSDNGYRLERPAALVKAQRAEGLSQRIRTIQGVLERAQGEKEGKANPPVSGPGLVLRPKSIGASTRLAGRAVVNLLGAIGSEALARIGPGDRVVYATHPTEAQLPLPASAGPVLDRWLGEQREAAEATERSPATTPPAPPGIVVNRGEPPVSLDDLRQGIGKADLVVTRDPTSTLLSARLIVAAPSGKTLATGSRLLWITPSAEPPTNVAETPVRLTGIAEEFARLLPSRAGTPEDSVMHRRPMAPNGNGQPPGMIAMVDDPVLSTPPSDALRSVMLHPEKTDPLTLGPSEALLKAAEAVGENLVVDLPDGALVAMSRVLLARDADAEGVLGRVAKGSGITVERKDAWIVGHPTHLASSYDDRVDREALGRLARAVDAAGTVRLDDLAAFATAQPKELAAHDLDGLTLRIINAGATQRALLDDYSTVRLYGLLSPAQRAVVRSGGSFDIADLSESAFRALARDAFTAPDGPIRDQPTDRPPQLYTSLDTERTEILPNGVPSLGNVTASVHSEVAAHVRDAKTGGTRVLTVSTLAGGRVTPPPNFAVPNSPERQPTYAPTEQTVISVTLNLGGDVMLTRHLTDVGSASRTSFVPHESLPEAFRTRVETLQGQLQRAFDSMEKRPVPVKP